MVVNSAEQFRIVIQANIEGLEQGIALLESMNNEQYCMRAKPYVTSSIGEHLRHILDLYYSVQGISDEHVVDYDVRRRGALIESCRQTGLDELFSLKAWLISLNFSDANKTVLVSTEVSVVSTMVAKVESTLVRELVFVSAHAIHHYALMTASAKLCDFQAPKDMGIAPATLTSIRGDSTCVQ